MPAHILDGKALAEEINQETLHKVEDYLQKGQRAPGLAVVLIGNDPASEVYVKNKLLACAKVGFHSFPYRLKTDISEAELLKLIDELNLNPNVDGILVQAPLPSHIDSAKIFESIDPRKDVDGFHPFNLGRLAQKRPGLKPCTPAGVMKLLNKTGVSLTGLKATVVGVSNIVGTPMILELIQAGCTVTACHRTTQDLKQEIEQADLVVAAAGSPHLIKGDWLKKDAIVIDVGMNRMDNGHFIGDVEFEKAKERASYITPVPGGVGPMTVATLLTNTLQAYESHLSLSPTKNVSESH